MLNDEVWNETEIIELLGLNKNQLSRLIREKKLPVVKLGNSKVFIAESILKWLKAREIATIYND